MHILQRGYYVHTRNRTRAHARTYARSDEHRTLIQPHALMHEAIFVTELQARVAAPRCTSRQPRCRIDQDSVPRCTSA